MSGRLSFWANPIACFFTIFDNTCYHRDLAYIMKENKDIVNKFRTDFDPYVSHCIKEIVTNKYLQEKKSLIIS